jgi:hypothetical protein
MTAKTASTKARTARVRKPDLEVILPPTPEISLNGMQCTVKPLKAREFFQLISIITSTLGSNAGEIFSRMGEKKDDEDFAAELLGVVLVAVPLAQDPFLRLIRDIVEPLDKEEEDELREYLWNPDPSDVLDVIDAVLTNEQDNLANLVGKARAYLKKWGTMMNAARGPKSST